MSLYVDFNTTLLPCPFCGCSAKYEVIDKTKYFITHSVLCTNNLCKVSIKEKSSLRDSKSSIISKWNLRQSSNSITAIAKVVESGHLSAEIEWLLNPLPPGEILYICDTST